MRRTTVKLLLCILFGVFFCVPESPPARIQSSQLVTMIHPLKTHALKGRYQPAELHGASLLIGKTTMVGPPRLDCGITAGTPQAAPVRSVDNGHPLPSSGPG